MELNSKEVASKSKKLTLVDIRRPEEWATTGVIEGCHLLTFNNDNIAGWLESLAGIAAPEDNLVLVCRSGRRTGIVLDFLRNRTPYRKARHMADGILGWLDNGLPVVAAE